MYTKIDELMWKDKKFKKVLSATAKLTFVYLLTCQHRNVLGIYNLPKLYIVGDMNLDFETVEKTLLELEDNEFIQYDEEAEVVLVNNFLKYNPLDNINQVKGAAKVLSSVPKTALFFSLVDILKMNNIKQAENLVQALNNYIKHNGFEEVKILHKDVLVETPKEDSPIEKDEIKSSKKSDKKIKKVSEGFDDEYTELYEKLYSIYPRKVAKSLGMTSFYKALENNDAKKLFQSVLAYKDYIEKNDIEEKFIKKIHNFFDDKVFEDYKDKEVISSNSEIDRLFKGIDISEIKVVNSEY